MGPNAKAIGDLRLIIESNAPSVFEHEGANTGAVLIRRENTTSHDALELELRSGDSSELSIVSTAQVPSGGNSVVIPCEHTNIRNDHGRPCRQNAAYIRIRYYRLWRNTDAETNRPPHPTTPAHVFGGTAVEQRRGDCTVA